LIPLPFDLRIPRLSEWIALLGGFYASWGYPLVLVAAALENTFLVTFIFPGGTMVLLGGIYARLGQLELPYVILAGWVGTFCGASIDYVLGRWGQRLLGPVLSRPDMALALERVGAMLRQYGMLALLAGHFVGPIRSLVAVSAGLARMEYWRFALYETPPALAWATAYALGGYFLADQIPLFEQILERFGWGLVTVVAAFLFWRLYLRPRARRCASAPCITESSAARGR
jgi:membrane protein DedA with SNARE-associated domain